MTEGGLFAKDAAGTIVSRGREDGKRIGKQEKRKRRNNDLKGHCEE